MHMDPVTDLSTPSWYYKTNYIQVVAERRGSANGKDLLIYMQEAPTGINHISAEPKLSACP